MPVSKKRKHPKKRKIPAIIPASSGFVISFDLGGLEASNGMLKAIHKEGKCYHAAGREDRASGATALTLEEFTAKIDATTSGLSEVFDASITKARHEQYLDGYEGRAYCDRVVFTRDYI